MNLAFCKLHVTPYSRRYLDEARYISLFSVFFGTSVHSCTGRFRILRDHCHKMFFVIFCFLSFFLLCLRQSSGRRETLETCLARPTSHDQYFNCQISEFLLGGLMKFEKRCYQVCWTCTFHGNQSFFVWQRTFKHTLVQFSTSDFNG